MKGYFKRSFAFLTPGMMLDGDSANGGNPPTEPKNDEKKLPNAEGNGGKSQEELDRAFSERATRAAEAERKKLWEAIGVKSQEEFDAFAKAKKEADDAQKSELQKLTEQATAEKARADKLAADKQTETEALQKRIVDGEIKLLASKQVIDKEGKVVRPAFHPDLLEDLPALINRTGIKEENGKTVGIEEAFAELATAKPRLLAEEQQITTEYGTPSSRKPKKNQTQETKKATWTL